MWQCRRDGEYPPRGLSLGRDGQYLTRKTLATGGGAQSADWTVGNDTQGATPDPGAVTADGDDDGDIDEDDEDVYTAAFGRTFDLYDVSVPA